MIRSISSTDGNAEVRDSTIYFSLLFAHPLPINWDTLWAYVIALGSKATSEDTVTEHDLVTGNKCCNTALRSWQFVHGHKSISVVIDKSTGDMSRLCARLPWFRGQGRFDCNRFPAQAHGTIQLRVALTPLVLIGKPDKPVSFTHAFIILNHCMWEGRQPD